jgi:hypothetical protein
MMALRISNVFSRNELRIVMATTAPVDQSGRT